MEYHCGDCAVADEPLLVNWCWLLGASADDKLVLTGELRARVGAWACACARGGTSVRASGRARTRSCMPSHTRMCGRARMLA